jgi:GT2 family glycosyltransferase
MVDVAALIPTLGNDLPRVQRAIAAVLASATELDVDVVVVVNATLDPFAASGITLPDRVRVVVVGANLGWAGGLQVGRTATTAHTLWLVQDDMEPDPDCLSRLVAALLLERNPLAAGSRPARCNQCHGLFERRLQLS